MTSRNRYPETKERLLRQSAPLLMLLWLLAAAELFAAETAPVTIRRFALISGVNDGGGDRVPLKYATTDARAMARVLSEIGGVAPEDKLLLEDPTREELIEAFQTIGRKIERAEKGHLRRELLFYYSGHSDEGGLLIGGELFKYSQIKEQIHALPADVHIAVVDSCASGALTRQKGGTRRAPFLVDHSGDVRGYAILTSSSADEAAQESDRTGASFFTHYLISGLRGAADTSRDGRVTLDEAYHYAFHETLSRTESTQAGPQHANYDFQLAGSGDLVLTDIRNTSAMLTLPAQLEGRVFIRDTDGRLVAEINKVAGHPMSLGLAPGEYQVTVTRPAAVQKGSVTLAEDQNVTLSADRLETIEAEETVARGDAPEEEPPIHRPVSIGIVPGATTDGGAPGKVLNNFTFNFIGMGDYLSGFELSMIGGIRTDDVKGAQLAGIFNHDHGFLKGAQIGGISNSVKGEVQGAQLGGIVNFNMADTTGFQLAGIYNHAGGKLVGAQLGGIANTVVDDVDGAQLAGIWNHGGGHLYGAQIGGIGNFVLDSAIGLQVGGIANYADDLVGLQLGGIANYAGDLVGLQLGGIANVAPLGGAGAQVSGIANVVHGEFTGAQLSLVNVGGVVTGSQIGLVNVATEAVHGAQVGLVNYAGNGVFAPTFWMEDTSLVNIGVKMGGPHVYTILGVGADPVGENEYTSLAVGIGGHIELHPFWVDLDLLHRTLQVDYDWGDWDSDNYIESFRVAVGYRVIDQLSLFVGPSLNLLISKDVDDLGVIPAFWNHDTTDYHLSMWPGFFGGIQWEPKIGRLNSRPAR